MKKSKKKKMSYGHGGGYNKPKQKARKGMKYADGGKPNVKKKKFGPNPYDPTTNKPGVRTGPVSPSKSDISEEMKKRMMEYLKKQKEKNKPQLLKKGGKLKPVDSKKNPGLAKLPTGVRNKMGYMEMGGKMKGGEAAYGMKMKKAGHGMKMQGMKDRRRMMNNMMTYMGGGKMKTTYKSGGTYRQLD